jgi:ubiquinone/menaquinone biosynthesis C-methylase UbiE
MSSIPSGEPATSCVSQTLPDGSSETVRAVQREEWGEVARSWSAFDPESRPISDRLIHHARIRTGDRVVDLACGTGMPALVAAEIVGSGGHVLGLDLVPEMIQEARRQAALRSLFNLEFRVITDESRLDLPATSYDAATSKHGLMWMPDPLGAARQLERALRPGARVAMSSWVPPENQPPISLLRALQCRFLGYRPRQPSTPAVFESEESLHSLLVEAAYQDVGSETMTVRLTLASSPEEYVEAELSEQEFLEWTGAASPATMQRLRSEAVREVGAMNGDGPVVIDLDVLLAWGCKPG